MSTTLHKNRNDLEKSFPVTYHHPIYSLIQTTGKSSLLLDSFCGAAQMAKAELLSPLPEQDPVETAPWSGPGPVPFSSEDWDLWPGVGAWKHVNRRLHWVGTSLATACHYVVRRSREGSGRLLGAHPHLQPPGPGCIPHPPSCLLCRIALLAFPQPLPPNHICDHPATVLFLKIMKTLKKQPLSLCWLYGIILMTSDDQWWPSLVMTSDDCT